MTHTHQEYVPQYASVFRTTRTNAPGFKRTALYFERLAQKETRDRGRRQRLLDVMGSYRSLAGIIPGIPEGYNDNNVGLPLTRAERWTRWLWRLNKAT